MQIMTSGMTISINHPPTAALDARPIQKFSRLASMTAASINGEKSACDSEKAYSQVVAPWLPVKCYYRLYYLESILMYLLNATTTGFGHGGHKSVRKALAAALESGAISFNGNGIDLAIASDWSTANSFRTTNGANISPSYYIDAGCKNSLRKKLTEYIELDWKQSNHIKDYRSRVAKTRKTAELHPKKFLLIDYFYWMRIKANYRDTDFLDFDNGLSELDAYNYLDSYIKAAGHYAQALESAIAALKVSRSMATTL